MPTHSRPPRLDPRAPLVLDTRELGRRPGSLRTVYRTVAAPEGLGLELIGVPPGADLELQLRLESVVEGVLVSGTVRAPLAGECGRCLDPVTSNVEADLQELFSYDGVEGDEETGRLQGDYLDLGPAVRDAVVLEVPLTPLCRDDCPGLCVSCGARLADVGVDHVHDQLDPRWAALAHHDENQEI